MGAKVHIQNFDIWAQDRSAFHNPADIFGENLDVLVEEEGSIFPIQKDELIKVEELYRCCDLNDDVLDLTASNQRMHYNFGEFLTLEYHPRKSDHDTPDSSLNLSNDAKTFFDGILGPAEAIFPHGKSNLSDSCEDYLVRDCFNVTDQQWLKNRLCLSSQNLFLLNDDDQSDKIMPTLNQCSKFSGTLFSNVFNFKKKPRLRRVKRKWPACNVPWKDFSLSEIEEDNTNVALKRSRKPPQFYVKEFTEKKNCRTSTLKHKKQHQGKRCEAKRFLCPEKTFNGECIQVPFGEPLLSETTEKKVHQLKESKGTGLVRLEPESKMDSVLVESQEDISEDDHNKEKPDNNGKKHHRFWSVSEVINLVEGVSTLGVGKWTHIKKLMFNSTPNRTSVDLKDKWRNLLRASCAQLKKSKKREALQRKHTSQQIPLHILHRVKELADLHPNPQPSQTCQTSFVTSPQHPSSENEICLSLSTAVKV